MKKLIPIFFISLITFPVMAENWIKFKAQAVEYAINTIVAKENRQAAADEYQKQMDQTTGKISVVGIYKVCAAAGKDIRTNDGYSQCRYFINQIADKSGFGTKSANQANCANKFNGVWTLSTNSKEYQCVGKDGYKLVYKKSCDGAGGECIKTFANLKTQGPIGREFIVEYGNKKNLKLTCYTGFETRRGVTSPLGQDYIRCSAGGKAYEFEFDSLNQDPGKISVESENKAMCEFFGGKIVKHPDSSVEKFWQSCEIARDTCNGKIHNLSLRIGHTTMYQGHCRLSRDVKSTDYANLHTIQGVDSKVFYNSGAQMRSDMAKVQLEEYLHNTFPNESYIVCDTTIKNFNYGLGIDPDYVMTCTVGSQQVDFLFNDLTEGNKSRADTGMDAMQCITNGGTFKGESCRGPTKDECIKLDAALRAKGSAEGAKWDDKVRACILGNAMKTYKQDVAKNYIVGAVVIVGGSVMVIASGGAATPVVVAGAEMLLTDAAFNVAIDLNHRRLSKQAANRFGSFISDAEQCSTEQCALNILKKHYATLSGVINDLNKDDQAVVDATMDRLIGMIKTEYVACGKNDKDQIVYATTAECAMKSSTLRAIDYIDTISEPVLIIGSILYNPGYVTKRFLNIRKISRIEKAEDLYRASIKTADDKKLFTLYMQKGNRDVPFDEFKKLYNGSASAAEEALRTKKTWAEISDARQHASALEKELDVKLKALGEPKGIYTDSGKLQRIYDTNPELKTLSMQVDDYKKLATNDAPTTLGVEGSFLQKQVDRLDDNTTYWAARWTIEDDINTRLKQGTISEDNAQKLKEMLKSNKDIDGLKEYEQAYLQYIVDDRNVYFNRFDENYRINKTDAHNRLKTNINNDIVNTVPIKNKDFVVAERKELYATIIDSDPTLRRQAVSFDKLSESEKMDFIDNILKKSDDYLGSSRGDVISAQESVRLSGGTEEKWAATSRGRENPVTNRITINLEPNHEGVNDIEEIMNTVAHENAHRVDDVNPDMGMLGQARVDFSNKVYSSRVADIYNNTLLEQSSNAIGNAVGTDIKRLTENRWQQMVALEDVTPAYNTARVVEGAKETTDNKSLDLILKYIDLATH